MDWSESVLHRPIQVGEVCRGECLYILLFVPKSESDVLQAMSVTDTGDAVLTPSVSAGSCVIVREVWWGRDNMSVLCSSGGPMNQGRHDFWGPGCGMRRWSFGQRQFTDKVGTTHGSRRLHQDYNPLSLQLYCVSPGIITMRHDQYGEDGMFTDRWPIVVRQDKSPTSSSTWCDDDLPSIASPPPSGTRGCRILPWLLLKPEAALLQSTN